MTEYISREDVINITAETGAWETQNRVRELPAVDVQPVDRWISVNDRLPEEIGYYLVIIGNDMLYSIDIAEYSENRWHKHDRVIYWQDLPDYPKSINGDE